MKKLENFTNALDDLLSEIEREQEKKDSPWRFSLSEDIVESEITKIQINDDLVDLLESTVKPEIIELLEHARKGEIFFKYGKRQRRLVSTWCVLESIEKLSSTTLGKKIYALQDIYNRL